MKSDCRAEGLLDAVIALFSQQGSESDFAAETINRKRSGLKPCVPQSNILPVCTHLEQLLLKQESTSSVSRVLTLFEKLRSDFHWQQNEAYRQQLGADFYDQYGYCNVVGPKGFFSSPDFSLGFLLLGPRCHYPEHSHPARELYVPISGEALWSRANGPYKSVKVGAPILHRSYEIHAMRTTGSSLLALYLWLGDISTGASLVGGLKHVVQTLDEIK
jgi:hypothetical protein